MVVRAQMRSSDFHSRDSVQKDCLLAVVFRICPIDRV